MAALPTTAGGLESNGGDTGRITVASVRLFTASITAAFHNAVEEWRNPLMGIDIVNGSRLAQQFVAPAGSHAKR
jgi:hypothetical protein